MNKSEKIQLITDVVAGRLPKSALRQGRLYQYSAVDRGGILVSESFHKDNAPISKQEFTRAEANPGPAIIWKEVRTYE